MQLFDQDEDVLTLEDEKATTEGLAAMITLVDGITSSWVFDDPNSVVYPFYLINEMNSNVAYFDVSSGIENLTTNNSPDNEHDFNKKDRNKIEPIENETVLINLGTSDVMQHLRTGYIDSSLSQKEKKDLMELLKEFQEVFAWSYEDMPAIDRNIAQHHIPTLRLLNRNSVA